MAKKFSGTDVTPWKLMKGNKIVVDAKGIKQDKFSGFKEAAEAATTLGGVPVRV